MKRRKQKPVVPPRADPGYMAGIQIRMTRYGVSAQIAKGQEVGHGLGRLVLRLQQTGRMTRYHASIMLNIASRCEEVIRSYNTQVLGAPSPSPRGVDMHRVDNGESRDELPDHILSSIRRDYDRIRKAVTERPNWLALERYCLGDHDLERWKVGDIRKLLIALDNVRDA